MIFVISGYGESASTPANGLNDLADRLRAAVNGVEVQRKSWEENITAQCRDLPADELILLIGHSYGGFRCYTTALELSIDGPRAVHVILFDPVRWGLDQIGGRPLALPDNVQSCLCFLKSFGLPWSSRISSTDGELFQNIPVAAGHNGVPQDAGVVQQTIERASAIFAGDLPEDKREVPSYAELAELKDAHERLVQAHARLHADAVENA